MRVIKIKVRFFVEEDGELFHAYCPEISGLHAAGDTEEEAIDNAITAFNAYIRIAMEHDDPIPLGAIESNNTYTIAQLFGLLFAKIFGEPRRHAYTRELTVQ